MTVKRETIVMTQEELRHLVELTEAQAEAKVLWRVVRMLTDHDEDEP